MLRQLLLRLTDNRFTEQDDMRSEKAKDEYYRDAAQYLNTGDRVGAESGEGISGTLTFLTRGVQTLP